MASDISRLSIRPDSKLVDTAVVVAKHIAKREVALLIREGKLNPNDSARLAERYKSIYYEEYHKYYSLHTIPNLNQSTRIVYKDNLACKRYWHKHTVVNFSKLNCFIKCHGSTVTVGRYNFPIDEDCCPETSEAFLSIWPGPLDKKQHDIKSRLADYIEFLSQNDVRRRIRYCVSSYDEQRKTILKLLSELLKGDGTVGALSITSLLLSPNQTNIKDEDELLLRLQKNLLIGKRKEAIKLAKSRGSWAHAQCLAFLHKYQPQSNKKFHSDEPRLKDDTIVQLNEDFINSLEKQEPSLYLVYKALLARICQTDPESVNILKKPNVGDEFYDFAILSANDCDMDFDQSNEIFRLITAIKKVMSDPTYEIQMCHLISLGLSAITDVPDPSDELSYRSHLSFKQSENSTQKTLTITNIDLLILNEVWEYCLNLSRKTTDEYKYFIDLLPYKLVFTSRLLDYGLHVKFYDYLTSINRIIYEAKVNPSLKRDEYFDWITIERSVELLNENWNRYLASPEAVTFGANEDHFSQQMNQAAVVQQPQFHSEFQSELQHPAPLPQQQQQHQHLAPQAHQENNHFLHQQIPSVAQQQQPSNRFHQQQQLIESDYGNPFDVPTLPLNEPISSMEPTVESRKQSVVDAHIQDQPSQQTLSHPPHHARMSQPAYSQQQQQQPLPPPQQEFMNMNKYDYPPPPANIGSPPERSHQQSGYSDYSEAPTFDAPYSPINENDNLQQQSPSAGSHRQSKTNDYYQHPARETPPIGNKSTDQQAATSSKQVPNGNSNGPKAEPRPAGDQQTSLFQNIFGKVLPKSNSKPMILPDDREPKLVYDEVKGTWIDKENPEATGNADIVDAPPVFDPNSGPKIAPSYSFAAINKSSKSRYPKREFQ